MEGYPTRYDVGVQFLDENLASNKYFTLTSLFHKVSTAYFK